MPLLKPIKLSGKTRKLFRQHSFARVSRLTVASKTAEEAHDRQDKEGRLEKEIAPLISRQETWFRRLIKNAKDRVKKALP